MKKPNQINFTHMKFCLVFDLHHEGNTWEEEVEAGCYEDIQYQLELFQKEDWETLFEVSRFAIDYASFIGIRFVASDDVGNRIGFHLGNKLQAWAFLSQSELEMENAKKLEKIIKIAQGVEEV